MRRKCLPWANTISASATIPRRSGRAYEETHPVAMDGRRGGGAAVRAPAGVRAAARADATGHRVAALDRADGAAGRARRGAHARALREVRRMDERLSGGRGAGARLRASAARA